MIILDSKFRALKHFVFRLYKKLFEFVSDLYVIVSDQKTKNHSGFKQSKKYVYFN